jgi:uncharacterized protein YqeY
MSQSLRERITEGMKEAMKSGDKKRLSTLRLMQSALKDKDIASRTDGRNEGIAEPEMLDLFAKMVKQRRESAEIYDQGGRPELAEGERQEIAIIESFMPTQLDDAATQAAVAAVIKDVGAASVKDMGKVMAELKKRHAGQMDFAKAGGVVKGLLG